MKTTKSGPFKLAAALLASALGVALAPSAAQATLLNTNAGGTFTFAYDNNALGNYVFGNLFGGGGFYPSAFWNTAASDYSTLSGPALSAVNGTTPISQRNLTHDITPVAASNPIPQAGDRHVISTTTNFTVDSDTLAGTGAMGMTGVQGFYAPYYPAGLVYGDFRLKYNPAARQDAWDNSSQPGGTPTGWFVENGIYGIIIATYDLANLSLSVLDANNWMLQGDLLMSPENGEQMLLGAPLTNVGDFCLGTGAYSGCKAFIPEPDSSWLLGIALPGLLLTPRRKNSKA